MSTTASALARFRKELIDGGFSDEYDPKHGASEAFQLVCIYAREDAEQNPLVVNDEPPLTYAVENIHTTLDPEQLAEAFIKAMDEAKQMRLPR